MKKFLIVLSVLLACVATSPDRLYADNKYLENFDWMVETFSANDAGYQFVIDRKGKDYYDNHTAKCREKVMQAESTQECRSAMAEWLTFFRRGHIGIWPMNNTNAGNTYRQERSPLRTVDLSREQFIEQYGNRKDRDPIVGIWKSPELEIAIIPDNGDTTFTAVIIRSDSRFYDPGHTKAHIRKHSDGSYSSDYYMGPERLVYNYFKTEMNNKDILFLGNIAWKRTYPETKYTVYDELLVATNYRRDPFVYKLSDQTLYLRIPSFRFDNKAKIDKLLSDNHDLITSTPNLIIDIRYGTGGSDVSFHELLKYVRTDPPMRQRSMKVRATELNRNIYKQYADNLYKSGDTGPASWCLSMADSMTRHMGTIFELYPGIEKDDDSTAKVSSLPYPARIGIIVNQVNASTDEQFIMVSKESKKVKIFGVPTAGALDFSNIANAISPDGLFSLTYTTTISGRVPAYMVDDIGLQPDYFLGNYDNDEWVKITHRVLENN